MFGLRSISDLVINVPEYDSLDLLKGRLTYQGDCKGRSPYLYIPFTVNVDGSDKSISVPCTTELQLLKNKTDIFVEIRSKQFSPYLIFPPEMKVWSVRANGSEVYSYDENVKRHKNLKSFNIIFLFVCVVMWIFLFRAIVPKKAASSE